MWSEEQLNSNVEGHFQEAIPVDGLQQEPLSGTEERNDKNERIATEQPNCSQQQAIDKCGIDYPDHDCKLNEYIDDTLVYLLERENRRCIKPHYLNIQPDLDTASRGIAVNYMVLLSEQFHLPPEVLHMAVDYMNRMLSKRRCPRQYLALLSATCLFMALRQEEIYSVSFNGLIYPSTMCIQEFVHFKWFVLRELNFEMYVPNMFTFVSMFAVKWKLPPNVERASYYIIEMALLEVSLLKYKPSLIAVSAIALARYYLHLQLWTEKCAEESGYTLEDLCEPYIALLNFLTNASSIVSTIWIQKKYFDVFQTFQRNAATSARRNNIVINSEIGCVNKSCTICDCFNDTLFHFLLQEKQRSPRPDYMNFQTNMDPFTRALAVDHLAQLSEEVQFSTEIIHMAVDYMDRFLSERLFPREDISLLSITCLSIGLRLKGTSVESLAEKLQLSTWFCYEIVNFEEFVLEVLNFELKVPNIYTFISNFASKWKLSRELECVSYYIAELILLDVSFLKFKPSVMSVTAIAFARFLLHSQQWTEECVAISGYGMDELSEPYIAVVELVNNLHTLPFKSIQTKYLNIFQNFYSNT